ncbi:glycosyltransferase [Achromobacter mucicolens]|uniref:glycosyltransferase n=1 Tax=Achromobacter mucicolens TaxID=1389922 RepID=UPI002449567F|nr:glycosyltransferase [Achromobacter mucicolens]MDH0089871.1 glycosyltransferase [Achromobacter mucicolens]
MSLLNLHLFGIDFKFESRTYKETDSLLDAGLVDQVEIAAFGDPSLPERDILGREDRKLWRVPIRSRRVLPKNFLAQAVKYLEWSWRIIKEYRRREVAVIHCHSMLPLLLACVLKSMTGARLVYDAHELETEKYGLHGRRQRIARWLEKTLIKHCDAVLVVSPSIERWYRERYPDTPVALVRNVPLAAPTLIPYAWRVELAIPDDALLFIFIGGLTQSRGIPAMLKAFDRKACRHHLLFMGAGAFESDIQEVQQRASNIHLRPPVPMREVLNRAAGADVGMCLIEETCLSYRYSLPNKLFESIQAGLPVITADLPDQKALLEEAQAGWTCAVEPQAIAAVVDQLSHSVVAQRRDGVKALQRTLDWSHEAERLKAIYRQLLPSGRPAKN